jgi:hypothetical protein
MSTTAPPHGSQAASTRTLPFNWINLGGNAIANLPSYMAE